MPNPIVHAAKSAKPRSRKIRCDVSGTYNPVASKQHIICTPGARGTKSARLSNATLAYLASPLPMDSSLKTSHMPNRRSQQRYRSCKHDANDVDATRCGVVRLMFVRAAVRHRVRRRVDPTALSLRNTDRALESNVASECIPAGMLHCLLHCLMCC
jgi:hypothetical protein